MPVAQHFRVGPLRPQEFWQPGPQLPSPTFVPSYFITGFTYDETGVLLGGCSVKLFRASDDVKLAETTSDLVTAFYFFALDNVTACYVVSKAGAFGRGMFGVTLYGSTNAQTGITDDTLLAV